MLQRDVNSKTYQYSLVRISGLSLGGNLVNNFNFLTIKKRIAMMNKKQSSLMHIAIYAILLPLIAAPILAFTACIEEPAATSSTSVNVSDQANIQVKAPGAVVYYIDGKEVADGTFKKLDAKEIESMNVFKGESAIKAFGEKAGNGIIAVTTRKNKNA
jgi:hypothetical protein